MRRKKSNAFKNVFYSSIYQIIAIVTSFLFPYLIIRHFGSEVNGLVNSITQFLGYITLLDLGFGPVVKASLYGPLRKKDNQKIANIVKASEKFFRRISIYLIIYIIALCFFMNFLAPQFDFIFTATLIISIAISTFFEYFIGLAYSLLLNADKKSYIINQVKIITAILSASLFYVLIKLGSSIQVIKMVSGIVFAVRPLFSFYYVKKKYKISDIEIDRNYKLKNKNDALAQHIAGIIHGKTDVLVLSVFVNQIAVSVYSVYYLVINGIQSVISNITDSLSGNFGQLIASNDNKKLNDKFKIFETLFYIIATELYAIASFLIVPFVKIYTKGITDANYIQPEFAIIITVSYFILALKTPYNTLANAAGLFKENRRAAITEATINLVVSVILVIPFGMIGVAIGTLSSVFYRLISMIRIVNKKILKRNHFSTIKICFICMTLFMLISLVGNMLNISCESYKDFFIYGMISTIISGVAILAVFYFSYHDIFNKIIRRGDNA